MTSPIGRPWTSTSYIDCSSVSGSMPCDMVRLPWGSMSTHRTRWPSSAKAAARFSVVVVFATPPFWLANAMTFAVVMRSSVGGRGKPSSDSQFAPPRSTPSVNASGPAQRATACRGGVPPGTRRITGVDTVDRLLADRRILICGGPGGVGKTTTSAAIAAGMAARGLRVAVVTIDPARRLATALGLEELGNEPHLVDPALFEGLGLQMRGELWAL